MFKYRALTTEKNKVKKGWSSFEFKDCPALLWGNIFFLAGNISKPIMYFNSIVRGHPTLGYYEGDRVFDKNTHKQLGVIVYNNGFYIQRVPTSCKKEIHPQHIYMVEGDRYSIESLNELERTPIEFKYSDTIYDFTDLVSIKNGIVNVLKYGKTVQLDANRVSELLYYNAKSGLKVFDGDYVEGDYVTIDTLNEYKKKTKEKAR